MKRAGVSDTYHVSLIGNSGRIVRGIVCPKCNGPVIYNGNHFCADWGYDVELSDGTTTRIGGLCTWALAHPAVSKEDRIVCDALGITYH